MYGEPTCLKARKHRQHLPLPFRPCKLLHFRQTPKVIVLEPFGDFHDGVNVDHSLGEPFWIPSYERVSVVDAGVKLSLKQRLDRAPVRNSRPRTLAP